MIWRNLHPICDNCWGPVVGTEKRKVRNLHHFFTYQRNPPCCWCDSPSHGQWFKQDRINVPCNGIFGFHTSNAIVIDFDAMREKYRNEDKEVIDLINLATGLRDALTEYESGENPQ